MRLFGTDGVRGIANSAALSPELALGLGRAAVRAAREAGRGDRPVVVIGRDTRRSGPMFEDALSAGVASAGGDAMHAGVLPTPGVAMLVRELGAACGAVISASHNPFADNGIKLFGADGFKLDDTEEDRLEAILDEPFDAPVGAAVGRSSLLANAASRYADWIVRTLSPKPHGLRVLVDCANGAASAVAPLVLGPIGGADVVAASPDGVNINVDCGSTHLGHLQALVPAGDYDLGLAFDGDADRLLAVDASGRTVDGDQILAILARYLSSTGRLAGNRVVVTSMSNLGFHRAMELLGIDTEVTDVGDRYVLAAMRTSKASLGGEQSGHVIALDHQTTGDGLVTAVLLLEALRSSGESLADGAALVEHFPQRLVNVRADRHALPGARAVWEVVERENEACRRDGKGRILLRASGTEPLVRVMVEHEDPAELDRLCTLVAALVEHQIGLSQA